MATLRARRYPATGIAALSIVAGVSSGCTGDCEGPGCEAEWPATRLAIHRADAWGAQASVWADAAGLADGTEEQGAGWAILPRAGLVWLGQPEAGAVLVIAPPDGTATVPALAGDVAVRGEDEAFGAAIALDGRRLIVGAPGADLGTGAVFVFDPLPSEGVVEASAAAWRLVGDHPDARLGADLRACPDVDGDGRAELLIASPGWSGGEALAGAAVWVWSARLAAAPRGDVALDEVADRWTGEGAGDRLGGALWCGADLTGDGLGDVLVGGSLAGPDDAGLVALVDPAAAPTGDTSIRDVARRVVDGPYAGGWFGAALATGDLDGDGALELVVGAPGFDAGRGRAHRYLAADWLADGRVVAQTVIASERTRAPGDHLGRSVAVAELDGDGRDDLLIGAPDWRSGDAYDIGRVWVWFGREAWGPLLPEGGAADATILGTRAFQQVGGRIAAADLDGDGRAELLLPTRADRPR